MQKQHFSIEINAPREQVWRTLWDNMAFRDWASLIDEGMYLAGELKEGSEVQFMSSVNEYGVTSLVEKFVPHELVTFRHLADTQDSDAHAREKEWTGGAESYALTEHNNVTTLTVDMDAPPGQEETFKAVMPKALERIKFLAEQGE